jgi:hypothetical protein
MLVAVIGSITELFTHIYFTLKCSLILYRHVVDARQ